jgi:hypothetical protein
MQMYDTSPRRAHHAEVMLEHGCAWPHVWSSCFVPQHGFSLNSAVEEQTCLAALPFMLPWTVVAIIASSMRRLWDSQHSKHAVCMMFGYLQYSWGCVHVRNILHRSESTKTDWNAFGTRTKIRRRSGASQLMLEQCCAGPHVWSSCFVPLHGFCLNWAVEEQPCFAAIPFMLPRIVVAIIAPSIRRCWFPTQRTCCFHTVNMLFAWCSDTYRIPEGVCMCRSILHRSESTKTDWNAFGTRTKIGRRSEASLKILYIYIYIYIYTYI